MSDEIFSPWNQPQENYANCGPTSLSYCLFTLFGNEINQDDVASSLYSGPRKWYKTTHAGFDQDEMSKAAGKFKAKAECLQVCGERNFSKFNKELVAHLKTGNPAMLSVSDGGHWVAIIGYKEKKGKAVYYVNDPDESGDEVFDKWTKADVGRHMGSHSCYRLRWDDNLLEIIGSALKNTGHRQECLCYFLNK
jgi:hypothetical protein